MFLLFIVIVEDAFFLSGKLAHIYIYIYIYLARMQNVVQHALPRCVKLEGVISASHQKIFDFLLKVNAEKDLKTELRVAGGWVRDTMLHIESNDIDIAIESLPASSSNSHSSGCGGSGASSSITGERFAREVAAYQAQLTGEPSRTVGVIRVNPELSKHIETATVCVCDVPVEFCALRSDDYSNESRIPHIRAATPLEDALRRDFTVNALFYNLHTGLVEDYTTGLADLQQRVLRCPLDPLQTFTDDPLRLLRGIRFVSQLANHHFQLDASIPACVDEALLQMMQRKVSRERVGKEWVKMMTSQAPQNATNLLLDMQIMQRVILVEVYYKQTPGKKASQAEVERTVYTVETVPESERALRQLRCLVESVVPMCIGANAAVSLRGDEEQLAVMLFVLSVIFYRGLTMEELERRFHALCVYGLKLPLVTFHATFHMIACYNALLRSELTTEEFVTPSQSPASLSDVTKMKLFDALLALHDMRVPKHAFFVVLTTYTIAEHLIATNRYDAASEMSSLTRVIWESVSHTANLVECMSLHLPLKGNELKSLLGIESKQIGSTLLRVRKRLVLQPTITREQLIEWLRTDANEE